VRTVFHAKIRKLGKIQQHYLLQGERSIKKPWPSDSSGKAAIAQKACDCNSANRRIPLHCQKCFAKAAVDESAQYLTRVRTERFFNFAEEREQIICHPNKWKL
jgi:hypothetical protein